MEPERLDALFGHRLRAGVAAYLLDCGVAAFTDIAEAMEAPNNLLSGHLQRLESAGVIVLEKGFFGRKPRTQVRLTQSGRAAWLAWLELVRARRTVDNS